ncbi:MAG: YicC/YloC family endoribonuclease [Syntrophales bacterium]|nr:YicC/YloC family endoribonuclease [Syntrophales bacterium]
MIRSMTGYGRAESALEGKKLVVEIRSLNHRNMEILFRLPGILFPLEVEIKKKISEKLFRGRVEVNVQLNSSGLNLEYEGKFELNLPLIRNYHSLLIDLKEELGLKGEISLDMITGLKGGIVPSEIEMDMEAVWEELEKTLNHSIEALIEMRGKEGEAIYRDFLSRLDTVKKSISSVKLRTPMVLLEYKKRLSDRVKELTDGMEIDETRLCQEVAIMAEKSDITEEVVRFESHIGQFYEMLESSGAVGRKIDFLLQEMNREVNTIGSKSPDAEISYNVIEIKNEISRLREQTMNIE